MTVSSITGTFTFICGRFTRTKVMVLCFLVWIAHVESYIMLWLVLLVVALPQVIQWFSPHRRNKTIKVTYESLIVDAIFVLTEVLKRDNLSENHKRIKCYVLFSHWDHCLALQRLLLNPRIFTWPRIQSWQLCVYAHLCLESCTKSASIPMIQHEGG